MCHAWNTQKGSANKKEEVLKLTTTMPPYKKRFYESLVVSDQAVDLEIDEDEDE